MFGFGQLIDILKKDPKKIVFTEGDDPRILEAASRLLAGTFLHPILIGNPDKIAAEAEECGFNIRGAEIIDPTNYDRMDEMVDLFCELRKSKGVTPEQARGILSQANYFGTILLRIYVFKNVCCLFTCLWSNLFFSRYRTSGITADQDKTGQHNRIFLLYHGTSCSYR